MNKRFQGLILGIISGLLLASGTVFALTGVQTIEAVYNNIKINTDGVQLEPKDANGAPVEPFIYKGTTYLPVRAISEAFGMQVEWDGNTNTVMIHDKTAPNEIYLVEACPAYEIGKLELDFKSVDSAYEYRSNEDKSFTMFGKSYTNGLTLMSEFGPSSAMYALNGKYSEISFEYGFVDNGYNLDDNTLYIELDGKVTETIEVDAEGAPQKITIPLNNALQMKIFATTKRKGRNSFIGLGNIVLR